MAETKIGRMVLGSYQTNCYFIYQEDKKRAIVVDPADQGKKIYDALLRNGITVEAILLTHGHFDHIWGTKELRESTGVKLYALDAEKALCEDTHNNVSDMTGRPYTVTPDEYLRDGQELTLAGISFRVIATPGHTIGSCCYYFPGTGFLVSGDTLFAESVGRTDFPTGSMSSIVRSIKEKLYVLPGETKVYPGHGDSTTIEHEMQYNPFTA
ncbi:MAG: MBL fold metallo-hydrolase [Acetatifactor sp.]|nr:MBL fold metallo-hydrolase [Acetatifactor sp.]